MTGSWRASATKAGLASFFVLSSLACGGGRVFYKPRSLSEGRPVRAVSVPTGTLEDEPFRALPPGRSAARARQLAWPTEARLSNGIRVVLLERHDFPSISAVLVLDRGASAAPPGVAALYAEAMLGSSAEYKADEAWEYLRFVGAGVRGDVWRDAVGLQVTALTPLFVSALSRTAPMFTSASLDGDDIDESRTHLIAERERASEDPADVASDALYASVFPAPHPYGIPVAGDLAGTPSTTRHGRHIEGALDRATNAAVRAFRDGNLSADHVGVACVGDFNPVWLERVLERALGKLPRRATTVSEPPAVPKAGRKVIVIDRPGAAQSSVAIGWPGPQAGHRDSVALDVLAAATGGDLSARLNITVRKELGASYGVRMSAVGLRAGGIIRISAAIDTAKTVDALRGLFGELERLRSEPLSDTELGAAKLRTSVDLDSGSTSALARHLAAAITDGLPPQHVVTYNARVEAVTAEAVRAGAERYLAPDEARVVVVGDAARIVPGLGALGVGEVTVTR
jgi:zinc protease